MARIRNGLVRAVFAAGLGAMAMLCAGCGSLARPLPSAGSALPAGFSDRALAKVNQPVALARMPDGSLLVTAKTGQLWLISVPGGQKRLMLDIHRRVCTERERGLTGVAVSPTFNTDHYIYLYYTYRRRGLCGFGHVDYPVNRLSRFRLQGGAVVASTEKVLLDNIPSFGGTHNAGDLHFKNSLLYVSVGDGGRDYLGRTDTSLLNAAARDRNVLLGKILRITASGNIPPSNPFQGPDTRRCATIGVAPRGVTCREIYATGLRNPFRFAFDPESAQPKFLINDVGEFVYEEIDAGRRAADYGWNVYEGPCVLDYINQSPVRFRQPCGHEPKTYQPPLFSYRHGACGAITGGAFVPRGTWPSNLVGRYLFADFNCGRISVLHDDRTPAVAEALFGEPQLITIVSMLFGAEQKRTVLYYATFSGGGEVRAISYR